MPKPHFKNRKEKSEYSQKLIEVARVTRVVKGGKRMSFRTALVIGNKKGKVGLGVAKGADVSNAISKAFARAKNNLVTVPIVNGTLPHETVFKFGASQIFLRPAKPGTGIIAGSSVRSVLELSGIKDVFSKIQGSKNKINNAKAVLRALAAQRTSEQVALERTIPLDRLPSRKSSRTVAPSVPKAEPRAKDGTKSTAPAKLGKQS